MAETFGEISDKTEVKEDKNGFYLELSFKEDEKPKEWDYGSPTILHVMSRGRTVEYELHGNIEDEFVKEELSRERAIEIYEKYSDNGWDYVEVTDEYKEKLE